MSKRKNEVNGDDITKKVISLFIPVSRKDPNYMSNYMKIKRRYENLDTIERGRLTSKAEDFWSELEKVMLY